MRRSSLAALLLLAFASAVAAQAPKRALTPADWDHWKSITGTVVSQDGKWVAYSLTPQVGDGEFVARSTSGSAEYHVPRGFIGRPNMTPGSAGGRGGGVPGGQISPDSRYALALTYAPMTTFDSARHSGRGGRAGPQPKASLAIIELSSGKVTMIPDVRSFEMPAVAGSWVAFQLDADSAAAGAGRSGRGAGGAEAGAEASAITKDSTSAHRKTPVGRLPYGLQKRVDLGRALAMEPRMLLLDEPMAGMNIEEKQDMSRFILDVNEEFGSTIVLIEHDMSVVMDISDRVVVLDYGRKIGDGQPDEVRSNPDVIRAYLGAGH